MVRVEHDVEAVVDHPLAALVGRRDRLAVQEHAERLGEARVPVLLGHLDAAGVNQPMSLTPGPWIAPLEPAAPAEHRVPVAQPDQPARELQQRVVGVLPVEPGDSLSWQ